MSARDRCRRQVDSTILEVGDAAGVRRKVVGEDQCEAESFSEHRHLAVGDRARRVADTRHQFLGHALDIWQVVVPLAHLEADLCVRSPGLLGCRGCRARTTCEFPMQPND